MGSRKTLTIIQMNDTHAYFDVHQEMFWRGDHAVYHPAGGYARIAAIVKQIRAESKGRILFCDCGDTIHGTYPALKTQGQALIPILNSLGLDAMTAHWEFAYGPKVFNQRVAELNFPMLASNVYDKETKQPIYRSSVVKEIGGLRIGLVGIASNIVQKWYKAFPVAKVCIGNHDAIITRKAFSSGISNRWVKDYDEVLGTPHWEFEQEHVIDGVTYVHGTGSSGKGATKRVREWHTSIVQGHIHTEAYVDWYCNKHHKLFAMQVGCGVDDRSYAMAYAKNFTKKYIISCGVVLNNGTLPIVLPMALD